MIHGQHVRQDQRIEEYSSWSGAQLVKDGQVVKAAEAADAPNMKIVQQELTYIKAWLRNGMRNIRIDVSHAPTVAAIKEQLTEEEQKWVKFGNE